MIWSPVEQEIESGNTKQARHLPTREWPRSSWVQYQTPRSVYGMIRMLLITLKLKVKKDSLCSFHRIARLRIDSISGSVFELQLDLFLEK